MAHATYARLPVPDFFDPDTVGRVWKVPYETLARQAGPWAKTHGIKPAALDQAKILLVLVDVQNTFCIPDFELFVAGRSGMGAVEDNIRLSRFIYQNLGVVTAICPTMDTHQAAQIFHAVFLVDENGNHPPPLTRVTARDVKEGRWRFNQDLATPLGVSAKKAGQHLENYVTALAKKGKYDLTVWPYHAMLGGIGHALVSAVEAAVFFHSMARFSQTDFQIKGNNPFSENYSALRPEVRRGPEGEKIKGNTGYFMDRLKNFDALVFAGQAKSHCLNFTLADFLDEITSVDPELAGKIYLLEDCTSPVVIENVVDYTDEADRAFDRFEKAGMHRVKSTDPMDAWPGLKPAG